LITLFFNRQEIFQGYSFQISFIQSADLKNLYHLPLFPIKASGGFGEPWNKIIFAPLGIKGFLKKVLCKGGIQ